MSRCVIAILVASVVVLDTRSASAQYFAPAGQPYYAPQAQPTFAAPGTVYAPAPGTVYAPPPGVVYAPPPGYLLVAAPPPVRPWSEIPHPWSIDATFGTTIVPAVDDFSYKATETLSYHPGRGIDQFFVGVTAGEMFDSSGFGLQLAARIGWDASIPFGDGSVLELTPYIGAGALVLVANGDVLPLLDAQVGLDLKRYFGDMFYLYARPFGLDFLIGGRVPLVAWDITAGAGVSF